MLVILAINNTNVTDKFFILFFLVMSFDSTKMKQRWNLLTGNYSQKVGNSSQSISYNLFKG